MARLFAAVDLTPAVREAVVRSAAALVRGLDDRVARSLRRVRPEQLHVTLVFLGEVPDAQVASVTDAMASPIALPAFDVEFTTAGTFPPRGPARVLWLGVGRGEEALGQLHDVVASRLDAVGMTREVRRFTPHLTIGRWPERGGPSTQGGRRQIHGVPSLRVSSVTLFRSQLRPQGPVHTPLVVTPLAVDRGTAALH